MIENDTLQRPQDAPSRYRGIGTPGQTFRCAKCGGYKLLFGRRKRKVDGLAQYVCAGCASE